jgi:arylsulfatase A-like enzyme
MHSAHTQRCSPCRLRRPTLTLLLLSLARATRRVNIVLMPWDDFGWADQGMYTNSGLGPSDDGSWDGATPHLDRLTREGIALHRHYVSHKCCPTRAELLTGRYSLHSGMWIGGLGAGNVNAYSPSGLRLRETTLADELRARNYSTYHVGEWHHLSSRVGRRRLLDRVGRHCYSYKLFHFGSESSSESFSESPFQV